MGTNNDPVAADMETLLNLSVFPSLDKLGYGSSSGMDFPNRALSSLFNRSHCQLTHFDLTGDIQGATSDDLISIVSDLPTITHLKLEDMRLEDTIMSDELLQRLAPTLSNEVARTRLLPRLGSLEFFGHKTFSWSCLANLVSTTTPDGSATLSQTNSIRRISFKIYHRPGTEFIHENSLVRFKSACDAGISINIANEAPLDIGDTPASRSLSVVNGEYPFVVFP